MPTDDNHSEFVYFLLAMILLLAGLALKNTLDIKWALKNERVQCK